MSAMKASQVLIALFGLLLACGASQGGGGRQLANVRPAAVAGQFYAAESARLKYAVQQLLGAALPARVDQPVALVVPHAAYLYSGQIAADAYNQVKGRPFDIVVLLGTNHTSAELTGISVWPNGAYHTPLGDAAVDETVAAALLAEDKDCRVFPEAQTREHSVEVQVPFVQVLFPAARIVPVVIGRPDPVMCAHFGSVLAKVLKNKRALIIASSDLSHFPSYQDALEADRQILKAIAGMNPDHFTTQVGSMMARHPAHLETCACGEGPILAAMTAAKALGATHGVVISYANTGDVVAQDRTRVVGYGSVVLAAGSGSPDAKVLEPPLPLPAASPLRSPEKKALLAFARNSLQCYLGGEIVPLARTLPDRMRVPQGAFVTLKQHGQLRGCIGHMAEDFPLGVTVGYMALQAGLNDTRFLPVSPKELPGLEIEISVLTPMKPVSKPGDIVVGRDGVVIRKDGRSAVFLPQVATEQGWGLSEMLDNLCLKAGLAAGSWKKGAQFLVFQAEVFSESEYR